MRRRSVAAGVVVAVVDVEVIVVLEGGDVEGGEVGGEVGGVGAKGYTSVWKGSFEIDERTWREGVVVGVEEVGDVAPGGREDMM